MKRPTEPTRMMLRMVGRARMQAVSAGFYKGRADEEGMRIVTQCRHQFGHGDLIARLLFTRDVWMHNCGWWKNPDYEQCEHLSLSFVDAETREPSQQVRALAKVWCDAFFGDYTRLLWAEPPYSSEGKRADVYHYRLFMHSDWKTPLLPRGEVYTREFTDAGWKSFGELHGGVNQMERDERDGVMP